MTDWQSFVPEPLKDDVERLCRISPLFVSLMRDVSDVGVQAIFRPKSEVLLTQAVQLDETDANDVASCMHHLRQQKKQAIRHLIWWELGLHGDIEISYQAIAQLATDLIEQALQMAGRLLSGRFGCLPQGRFCVVGLGKLGGYELNLGSDVDLLFLYDGVGHTEGGRKSLSASEYYAHVARMLIRLLSERTTDGMVWPVDMRLRPGGDSASIVLSLDATVSFYQNYGQTWERAMLIKAAPVAGDIGLGKQFIEGVSPFVYRRYLDYTTVAALADMKRRIDAQAMSQRIATGFDVKRGRGGIREIEFIVQSLQLLQGGRHMQVRLSSCMQALQQLQRQHFICDDDATVLRDAYLFWRRIEHAIQARTGEQTQKLPEAYAEYLEAALQQPHIEQQMLQHVDAVAAVFAEHIGAIEVDAATVAWLDNQQLNLPQHLSETEQARIQQALQQIKVGLLRGMLPERSYRQVERVLQYAMPLWLADANAVQAVEAFSQLLKSIAGRATWIDLLATHRGVLDWLVGVLSASRYVAEHIVRDPSWLEWPLEYERGQADIHQLCQNIQAIDVHDVEQALLHIGRGVDRGRLLCALAVDAHDTDALTIGAWMADIADAATQASLRLALQQLQLPQDFPFVALAMGKHGSREMGLVSDLDMVFVLVDDKPMNMLGKRSKGEHAQRLGRRVIQYLATPPPFGAGFEFDARLRPSGNSGVLVTTLDGFKDYQLQHAQTWEHQALCRARAVAGPAEACHAVMRLVEHVLAQPRDRQTLAEDVKNMRQKMLRHLSEKSAARINLKHDAGGLVDIEFLAQFACLAYRLPQRGTLCVFEQMQTSTLEQWQQHASFLAQSWLAYRQMENALRVELWQSIGELPTDNNAAEWETLRRHDCIESVELLQQRMQKVHEIFWLLMDEA